MTLITNSVPFRPIQRQHNTYVYYYRTFICYLLITITLCCNLCAGVYLNEFAVHIRGGRSVANRIAAKHGMVNLGQVGNLKDHYILQVPHIHKRSASPNNHHHQRLSQESEVVWAEQQFAKSRVKRDLTFVDPLWSRQWYLHHGGMRGSNGPKGFDMSVQGAWKKGYTGKGIVITILDDGIERDHPDLVTNYDPYASYDINSRDSDPMPRYDYSNENRHGTRCAGEVAASANNSVCIVGVAYNAGIGGVRMLDGSVYDRVEADSLSFNHTHVDIYSASWGPDDNGRVVDGPGKLAKAVFAEGIKSGRKGKGNIFMWASGNGGRDEDSCSCDGYTNSIYTLSISSTSQHGSKPWYLEECSSTLATTYSSGNNLEPQIITTDLHKSCTNTHTGTSASAPLAAGLVALALEANPALTWRDVQYITLLSANPEPMADGEWKVNAMNRKVSLKYGYGLMNATSMVELAERWTTLPEQHICSSKGTKENVPLYKYTPFQDQITTDGCDGKVNEVRYLEHVHITVTLNYNRRGDLTIHVISPSGTNSTLLPKRNRDMGNSGFDNWDFLSVHFWEENPAGSWKIHIQDRWDSSAGDTTSKGELKHWSITLYGTKEKPVNLRVPTGPTSTTPSGVTGAQNCHEQCLGTCFGPSASQCRECRYYRIQQDGTCVAQCPVGYRPDKKQCVPCSGNCKTCTTVYGYKGHCQKCETGFLLLEDKGTCVPTCPTGYYLVTQYHMCRKCAQQCESCTTRSDFCLSCAAGMTLQNNKCSLPPKICPEGYYKEAGGQCKACGTSCGVCNGQDKCVRCKTPTSYVLQGRCVEVCDVGYLPHVLQIAYGGSHRECRKCNKGVCNSCSNGFKMTNSVCIQENACQRNYYYDWELTTCKQCHRTCDTCHGPAATDCNSCNAPLMFHPYIQACVPCCLSKQSERTCCKCDVSAGKCIVGEANKDKGEEGGMDNATMILTVVVIVIALIIVFLAVFIFIMLRNNQHTLNNIQNGKLSTNVKYEKLANYEI